MYIVSSCSFHFIEATNIHDVSIISRLYFVEIIYVCIKFYASACFVKKFYSYFYFHISELYCYLVQLSNISLCDVDMMSIIMMLKARCQLLLLKAV